MTPIAAMEMEAPVKEKTENPVVVKTESKKEALEQCFNAVEDHTNGQINTREFHAILRSYGFTQDSLNQAYLKTTAYGAVFEGVDQNKY